MLTALSTGMSEATAASDADELDVDETRVGQHGETALHECIDECCRMPPTPHLPLAPHLPPALRQSYALRERVNECC